MSRDFFFVPCKSSIAFLNDTKLAQSIFKEIKWKFKLSDRHDRNKLRFAPQLVDSRHKVRMNMSAAV